MIALSSWFLLLSLFNWVHHSSSNPLYSKLYLSLFMCLGINSIFILSESRAAIVWVNNIVFSSINRVIWLSNLGRLPDFPMYWFWIVPKLAYLFQNLLIVPLSKLVASVIYVKGTFKNNTSFQFHEVNDFHFFNNLPFTNFKKKNLKGHN